MTKRKPFPTGFCPHCGVQYIALTQNDLLVLAWDHVEGEHPGKLRNYAAQGLDA